MEHTTEIKIRGYHLDFYGHVNNARYLELMEEARWQMFEEDFDFEEWRKNGWSFFVVRIDISYKRPASLGETVEIRSQLTKIGRKSATLNQRFFLKGTDIVITDADVTFVVVDSSGKATRIEGDLLATLQKAA